jgi:hypothetical protein
MFCSTYLALITKISASTLINNDHRVTNRTCHWGMTDGRIFVFVYERQVQKFSNCLTLLHHP